MKRIRAFFRFDQFVKVIVIVCECNIVKRQISRLLLSMWYQIGYSIVCVYYWLPLVYIDVCILVYILCLYVFSVMCAAGQRRCSGDPSEVVNEMSGRNTTRMFCIPLCLCDLYAATLQFICSNQYSTPCTLGVHNNRL